jgi:hypothetical protein
LKVARLDIAEERSDEHSCIPARRAGGAMVVSPTLQRGEQLTNFFSAFPALKRWANAHCRYAALF